MITPDPATSSAATVNSAPIVGIDLGTTFSLVAVAHWPPGGAAQQAAPRIIPDEAGRPLCPSVVRYHPTEPPLVGFAARDSAADFPLQTISSVKRLMGRSAKDAAPDAAFLPYTVVPGEGDTARVQLPWGKVLSPQEVSAHILAKLKAQASAALGVPVTRAVITVPAYFDDAQRQATRDAARLAGLEAVRIVAEPTAAALAYGLGVRATRSVEPEHVVVFDFGGGTFDVSILRITPAERHSDAVDGRGNEATNDFFEVLATAGDTHLGGDDVDRALSAVFSAEIASLYPGIEFTPALRRRLAQAAETAKITLSDRDSASVRITADRGEYTRTVSRGEFEKLIEPLVDRTLACCKRALRDARRALGEAKPVAIVLVGGSTRIPLVRKKVGEFFGLAPYTALDPDKVIALGAAVQASIISGANTDALLLDVIPLSLGLETVGGAVAKIIMRNSTVPAQAREMFSTSVDSQTSIKLHVLQGEREMVADCRSLGTFHLRGIPPMPAGIPQVEVEFHVDSNGILAVSAVERRSGKRAAIQVVPNHGLSRAEVERIEAESFAHAREDMQRHRITDLVANSKLDLHWINRQLGQHARLLTPDELGAITSAIAELGALVTAAETDWKSVNGNAFNSAKEKLDRASMRLHEVAIAESLKST